jgi:ribonuclease HI
MGSHAPHFLLFSEAGRKGRGSRVADGRWRFVLQSVEDESRFSVQDEEPQMSAERLELLAVVRGLEALDQPSRVTLVTRSDYVTRGLRYGLEDWRANRWRWELDGRMVPVKNDDLWRRVDQALKYHRLDCRTWRFDSAHHDLDKSSLFRFRRRDGRAAGGRQGPFSGLVRVATKAGRWISRWFRERPTSAIRSAA